MMTRKVLGFLGAVAVTYAQMGMAPGRGQMSIVVKGEDGTVLDGVHVSLERTDSNRMRQRLPQQTLWRAVTSAEGAAQFDYLPQGQFTVCAAVRGPWLNPCEWGSEKPSASISEASKGVTANVVLKRGAPVTIEVEDPGGLLAQHEGKTPGAHLLLGVRNDAGMFTTASLVSENSRSRLYSVIIPFGARVNLVVASPFFRLTDSIGAAFAAAGASLPLLVPSGQTTLIVRLGVSGRKS